MAATIPVGGKVPQIFIAHASEDKPEIRELYGKLKAAGYQPWLDEEDLLPGQNWREEIPKALKNSDLFLACLSSTSISKRGYIQREFKMAMEMLAEFPPGNIYLIPLKLDDCQIPDLNQSEYGLNLRDIQWLDYYQPNGFEKLIKAIEHQFGKRETQLEEKENITFQNHQGVGDNVSGNKSINNYYLADKTSNTEGVNTAAIEIWTQKLAHFQQQEAIASDPAQKFQLKMQIQECEQKIRELERTSQVLSGNEIKDDKPRANKKELLKVLKQITPAQFNELIFNLDVNEEYLPSPDKPQIERAIALLKLAQAPGGMGLQAVQEALEDVLT
jgi:hypothetical protein